MSQSDSCNEISVISQESKINGKIDSIEGQLSFMGEGSCNSGNQPTESATKEDHSFSLPNLSLFPKRFDDNQDPQDDLRSATDLPNGHNNPDAVDIVPRTKSLDELLQESEDLPDTELIGCTKEFVESKMDTVDDKVKENDGKIESKELKEENKKVKEAEEEKQTSSATMKVQGVTNEDKKDVKQEVVKKAVKEVGDNLPPTEQNIEKISTKNQGLKTSNENNRGKIKVPDVEEKSSDVKKDDSLKLEINESQFIPDTEEIKEINTSKKELKDESPAEKEKDRNIATEDINEISNTKNDEISETDEVSTKVNLPEKEVNQIEEIEECNCTPDCHIRMKLIKTYLDNACNQLGSYIKQKKQEELSNFLKLLSEIELISENKKNEVSEDLLSDAFQEEDQGKKRKPRASKLPKITTNTPQKAILEKKSRTIEDSKEEPMSEINFKNLKGLAVFAKWPNSGWYYPGIIEGLTNSDWKEATNVTVKFYDGLVREMKNINILPAHLIPETSIVCDLDDETEMVVLSTNRIDNNNVEFTLSTKEGSGKNLELSFNKLAIRALYMKSIKQQLEPNMDVIPKKMHMVSLDNLVSGRRSRIRTHKDDDDDSTENTTPRKNVRKSVAPPDPDKSVDESVSTPTATKLSPNKRQLYKRLNGMAEDGSRITLKTIKSNGASVHSSSKNHITKIPCVKIH